VSHRSIDALPGPAQAMPWRPLRALGTWCRDPVHTVGHGVHEGPGPASCRRRGHLRHTGRHARARCAPGRAGADALYSRAFAGV